MAVANSTGVRSHADHRITPPHFPSHVAARVAADWDNRRPVVPRIPGPRGPVDHRGDSDPNADELLKWARNPRGVLPVRQPGQSLASLSICGLCGAPYTGDSHVCASAVTSLDAVRLRMETEAAYLLRDRQGYDEYREWAQGEAA